VVVSLGDKLRRLNASGRGPVARPAPTTGIEAVVPGRFEQTSHGPCYLVERRYPLSWQQGAWPLAAGLDLSPRACALLTRGRAADQVDPRRAVFLDTETTGLSGGTGTYAFLVGLGYVDGAEFVIRQYFMRHPGEEPALLTALEEVLADFPLWITFNGKAFDQPLLETRYRYTRRSPAPAPSLHLDLLHPARRLWRNHLPSCALSSLEQALLRVRRAEDVPSWMIPTLYFDYVRRGKCDPLRAVFAHNAEDLLSLVALLGLLSRVLDEPPRYAEQVDVRALLRVYVEAGHTQDALDWCEAALDAVPAGVAATLRWELAMLLRRTGRREAAAALWRDLAAQRGAWSVEAQVELAKHLEHRQRDYHAAREAVEAALVALTTSRLPGASQQRLQLERRLGRLHFRVQREQASPAPTARRTRGRSSASPTPESERVALPRADSGH
jgi:uncharacterized protein YprB with RNaseH-like and TPR domain